MTAEDSAALAAAQGEASAASVATMIVQEKLQAALNVIGVLTRERDEMEKIAERSHDDILRLSRELDATAKRFAAERAQLVESIREYLVYVSGCWDKGCDAVTFSEWYELLRKVSA